MLDGSPPAGGAMQQASAEMALQRLDLSRYATFRQAKGIGGARETLQFRDANEELHCVNFIHTYRLLLLLMKQ